MSKKCVDLETKRKCAFLTLKWCRENLGINYRKKSKPKIAVRVYFPSYEDEKTSCGSYYFEDNKIIIYDANCETIQLVINTVIHEYTHYLQSGKKYWDFFKTHQYSNHPYEKHARRNEKKYGETCLFEIWDNLYT